MTNMTITFVDIDIVRCELIRFIAATQRSITYRLLDVILSYNGKRSSIEGQKLSSYRLLY